MRGKLQLPPIAGNYDDREGGGCIDGWSAVEAVSVRKGRQRNS